MDSTKSPSHLFRSNGARNIPDTIFLATFFSQNLGTPEPKRFPTKRTGRCVIPAVRRRWRRSASAGVGSTCFESVLTAPTNREPAVSSKENWKQAGDIFETKKPLHGLRFEVCSSASINRTTSASRKNATLQTPIQLLLLGVTVITSQDTQSLQSPPSAESISAPIRSCSAILLSATIWR